MKRSLPTAIAVTMVAALALPSTGADGAPAFVAGSLEGAAVETEVGGASCGWSIAAAPSPRYADLRDIDGLGADNIWAVGLKRAGTAPLIMHWKGRRWTSIPAPAPSNFMALEGIDVRARRDVWAVGWYAGSSGLLRTLILHWNGNRWIRIPSPNPLSGDNLLIDVAAAGPNKAWAVGTNDRLGFGRKIILRWNGRRWVNDGPGRARGGLESVAVRSGTVIAAGYDGGAGPLVMRRTANGWVKSPMAGEPLPGPLESVDAAGSGPFRAVGKRQAPTRIATRAMHSSQSGWVEDVTPNRGPLENILHDVSARSGTEAWAVGYYQTRTFVNRTLSMRFANGSWSRVATPNPNQRGTELLGVYAVPRYQAVWAVGFKRDSINASHPLVMRYRC